MCLFGIVSSQCSLLMPLPANCSAPSLCGPPSVPHLIFLSTVTEGVFYLNDLDSERFMIITSFLKIPNHGDLVEATRKIVDLIQPYQPDAVMLGGAPYLIPFLERHLNEYKVIYPVYRTPITESLSSVDNNTTSFIGFYESVCIK